MNLTPKFVLIIIILLFLNTGSEGQEVDDTFTPILKRLNMISPSIERPAGAAMLMINDSALSKAFKNLNELFAQKNQYISMDARKGLELSLELSFFQQYLGLEPFRNGFKDRPDTFQAEILPDRANALKNFPIKDTSDDHRESANGVTVIWNL